MDRPEEEDEPRTVTQDLNRLLQQAAQAEDQAVIPSQTALVAEDQAVIPSHAAQAEDQQEDQTEQESVYEMEEEADKDDPDYSTAKNSDRFKKFERRQYDRSRPNRVGRRGVKKKKCSTNHI